MLAPGRALLDNKGLRKPDPPSPEWAQPSPKLQVRWAELSFSTQIRLCKGKAQNQPPLLQQHFLPLCCTSQRWTGKEIPHRQPECEPLLSVGILRGKAQEGGQNRTQPGFTISYCFQILFYFIHNRLFLTLLEGPWPICLLV